MTAPTPLSPAPVLPLYSPLALHAMVEMLRGRRTVVLAGAGCSTESGIPDYRGPEGRNRVRSPVQYRDFTSSPEARARYWARSTVGWTRIGSAEPNAAHRALASLESDGLINGVITQNVDGLHHAGGSRHVVELHGSLAWVRCLSCAERSPRAALQERLVEANPGWLRTSDSDATKAAAPATAPDGDAEVADDRTAAFEVPACQRCGGVLKPDVVFFGESVPSSWVRQAWALLDDADALLVVGSSLTVYSGRRFLYRASESSMPIGIVNIGPTRGDDLAEVKVEGRLGEVLPAMASELALD